MRTRKEGGVASKSVLMTHKRHSLRWIVALHNGHRAHFAHRAFLF
jgi:hypothetical protein